MNLKIETFFKVSIWNKRFLLSEVVQDWKKATLTNQGLDRIGDSFWITGVHIGSGTEEFRYVDTGLYSPIQYSKDIVSDSSDVSANGEKITWSRLLKFNFTKEMIQDSQVKELSLSWDADVKTATALLNVDPITLDSKDQVLVVECRVDVHEYLTDIHSGVVDFGASKHRYTIKPCHYTKYPNPYIGTPLLQKSGKVYSGGIPANIALEPTGSIDTNLANFTSYVFDTQSKVFSNFFTLSSPNAVTTTATTHTFGLPSAFGIEFDPPIDKDFNREMTLNYRINWDRG